MKRFTLVALLLLLEGACTPLGDLDSAGLGKASAGSVGSDADASDSSAGGVSGTPAGAEAGALEAASSGEPGAGSSNGIAGEGPGSVARGGSGGSVADGGSGGLLASGGGTPLDAGGEDGTSAGFLTDLPNDQPNSPVRGNVSCVEASFLEQPTFEVHTPTANFMVRRASGDIISISDRFSIRQVDWLGYNDYRPRRSAGVVTDQRQHPRVTTNLDADSVTARHVRLRSESSAGDWAWVWDFYPTQATLTVSRAPGSFGFLYSGTPGGQLDDADQIVLASGVTQSAKDPFLASLPGAGAWLYFADPVQRHSLFLIQHRSSSLLNRYEAVDADSATLLFGDGQISQVPSRFSLGLIDHTDLSLVTDRAEFVIAAVQ